MMTRRPVFKKMPASWSPTEAAAMIRVGRLGSKTVHEVKVLR